MTLTHGALVATDGKPRIYGSNYGQRQILLKTVEEGEDDKALALSFADKFDQVFIIRKDQHISYTKPK